MERHAVQPLCNFFITHLTNSIDFAINDICYECSQNGVCLNSFDCVFVHKEISCTNKTEIKDGLQYTNKKQSLPGDIIIYEPEEDLEMKEKHRTFYKSILSSWSFIFMKQHRLLFLENKCFWTLKT